MTDDKFDLSKADTALNLAFLAINDAEATLVASVIRFNGALQTLDLHGNRIGDEGAIAIGKGLESNSKLLSRFP